MNKIIKSALLLAVIYTLSRVLGPLKNILIAQRFGVSRILDGYFMAQNIIDVVLSIFSFTVITIAIPVFVEESILVKENRKGQQPAISSFINQNFLLAIVLTVVLFLLAVPFSRLIPGFSTGLLKKEFALLIVANSIAVFFIIPIPVLRSFLHAGNRFVLPALADSFPALCTILCILFFSHLLGIFCLPAGYITGNALIFLSLFVLYWKNNTHISFSIRNMTIIKKVKHLVIPTMICSGSSYIMMLTDQIVASGIADGAISQLSYAFIIIMLPFSLITIPFLTTVFPEMSRGNLSEDPQALKRIFIKSVIGIIFLFVPITIFLFFFRSSLVTIFYYHGAFTSTAVKKVSSLILAYIPALFFLNINNVFIRVFFVKKKMTVFMYITLFAICLNVVLDLLFSSFFSVAGIAFATSMIECINFLFIYKYTTKYLGFRFAENDTKAFLHIVFAGLVSAVFLLFTTIFFPYSVTISKPILLLRIVIISGVILAIYFFLTRSLLTGFLKTIRKNNHE